MPRVSYEHKVALLSRALRNLFGMNQGELARLAGASRPTIARLETLSGERVTRLDTLERIVDVFRAQGVEVCFEGEEVVVRLPEATMSEAAEIVHGERQPSSVLDSNSPDRGGGV